MRKAYIFHVKIHLHDLIKHYPSCLKPKSVPHHHYTNSRQKLGKTEKKNLPQMTKAYIFKQDSLTRLNQTLRNMSEH